MCRFAYDSREDHLMEAHERIELPQRPQQPEAFDDSQLRASDEDRERAATQLRDHCAAGRLTAEELDERLGDAYRARTLGELNALLRDLPGAIIRYTPERLPARRLRPSPALVMAVVALVALIAVATDGHAAWIFWPLVFIFFRRGLHGRRRGLPYPR